MSQLETKQPYLPTPPVDVKKEIAKLDAYRHYLKHKHDVGDPYGIHTETPLQTKVREKRLADSRKRRQRGNQNINGNDYFC